MATILSFLKRPYISPGCICWTQNYKHSFNTDNTDKKSLTGIFRKMLWCDVKNNEVLLLMLIGYSSG